MVVDPRNTSRTCPACGHCERANRWSQAGFKCKSCGFEQHADVVAAKNIARRAAVNRPIVSGADAGNTETLHREPLPSLDASLGL
jgi:putative transposase